MGRYVAILPVLSALIKMGLADWQNNSAKVLSWLAEIATVLQIHFLIQIWKGLGKPQLLSYLLNKMSMHCVLDAFLTLLAET